MKSSHLIGPWRRYVIMSCVHFKSHTYATGKNIAACHLRQPQCFQWAPETPDLMKARRRHLFEHLLGCLRQQTLNLFPFTAPHVHMMRADSCSERQRSIICEWHRAPQNTAVLIYVRQRVSWRGEHTITTVSSSLHGTAQGLNDAEQYFIDTRLTI